MNNKAVRELYDAEMRRDRAPGPTSRVERLPLVTRVTGDTPGAEYGCIMFSALSAENADATIENEKRHFDGKGLPLEWKVFAHDLPGNLGDRLVRHGFRQGDRESLQCLEIAGTLTIALPEGIRVTKLDSPSHLDALLSFDSDAGGPGGEAIIAELRREMTVAPDQISVFVAWMGSRPVSKGWIRYYPGRRFADLWGGETLREFRGKGIYKSLVAARLAEAKDRGAKYLTTDALPTSRPILEKLGFRELTTTTPYQWIPM
jgi:GNAT superfamily N-acetyltransferase